MHTTFVPALLGRAFGDLHWEQLVLPLCKGGLSLDDAVTNTPRKHAALKMCTAQLTQVIVDLVCELPSAKKSTDAAKAKAICTENATQLPRMPRECQAADERS